MIDFRLNLTLCSIDLTWFQLIVYVYIPCDWQVAMIPNKSTLQVVAIDLYDNLSIP